MVNDTQPNAINGEHVNTRMMIQELASISLESSADMIFYVPKYGEG
jgi:hypothetical protein